MDIRRQEALEYHTQGQPGKIEVVPTKPLATQRDLSLAYSPGVAEPCREIEKNPDDAFKYTARGNLVGVVSNGTAVLGLGNIGALAGKPVMEGKGVLFKKFAGIDVFDIEVATEDVDEMVRFCELLEPTLGGINLEDIKAPECFDIEKRLKESLQIPVFHDDQHGTAIIGAAALLNALDIVGKPMDGVKVVFSGAGASALATADHLEHLGIPRKNMLICDSKGVIYEGRTEGMNKYKEPYAVETDDRTLEDAMKDADVFIGLSVRGVVTPEMVASMARDPIIFALANPDPEILPEEVAEIRDDAIMATGRSDYPNQVNNVLGFPFIFRGALDVRARGINEEMKVAATRALADLARQEVPESVIMAYGGEPIEFGRDYLIPKPFDPRVLLWEAPAVAEAAMRTGEARIQIDLDEYRDRLMASLGPGQEVMRSMVARARRSPKRVVMSDGEHTRVVRAAVQLLEDRVAHPILLGSRSRIEGIAKEAGLSLDGIEVLNPVEEEATRERYAQNLFARRQRKGLTLAEARANLYKAVNYGGMMLHSGDADAMVAGIDSNYPEVIRPSLQVVGRQPGVNHVAGLYMVARPHKDLLFFADTTVNISPDAETLAEVARLSANFVRELGIEPRIAMVSFSNFGSVRHPEVTKVQDALTLVRAQEPDLIIDGEMQADNAVNPRLLMENYPFSNLREGANILVFSTLSAANASYKLMGQLGGAEVIGPVLLGMAKPIHLLQRGGTTQEVFNLAVIASVDAANRE